MRFFGPALLTTSAATKYTCPESTIAVIQRMRVSNATGSPVTFTLSIGADAAGTRLYDSVSIPPGMGLNIPGPFTLFPGEIMQAFAGSNSALVLEIDGTETAYSPDTVTWYVAKTGSDSGSGSSTDPFLTINHALSVVAPGEIIEVRVGTYREQLNPITGGTSDSARVVVRAATGQTVKIKGSEQITGWTSLGGGRWQVVIPDSFFGSFNPYSSTVFGSYLSNSGQVSRGRVYLNEVGYTEAASAGATTSEGLWFGSVGGGNTTITANFGAANPNSELTEINVRPGVVLPVTPGLGYISLFGFDMMQAATQWSDAEFANLPQTALLVTTAGHNWLIERCRVAYSVCSGIGFGLADYDFELFPTGSHMVRYCTIEQCGQAGINGSHNEVFSKIEYCLIQDINVGNQFAGYEIAGIKFHSAVDVLIKHSVIRRVYQNKPGFSGGYCPGIWLDWQSQGSRVTETLIYDIEQNRDIVLEADHGPTLIDNNVLASVGPIENISECTQVVNNILFGGMSTNSDARTPAYWVPHTITVAGTASIVPNQDHYYNNIYMGGVSAPSSPTGGVSDYHVVYNSGGTGGNAHSVSSSLDPALAVVDHADGATVNFTANSLPVTIGCPLVDPSLVGFFTLPNQSIAHHDGTPIVVDTDAMGVFRGTTPSAGPFQNIANGANSFTWSVGKDAA